MQAGTTLVWTNRTASPQTVTSGPPPGGGHADVKPQTTRRAPQPVHRYGMKEDPQAASETPVEGLEQTLQVEITHAPTGVSRVLDLRPVFGQAGRLHRRSYTHGPGCLRNKGLRGYRRQLSSDETFVSRGGGGGNFSDVLPATDSALSRNLMVPAAASWKGPTRGALDTAQQAQDAALTAQQAAAASMEANSGSNTLAISWESSLGAVGLASGVGGLVMAMRKR